MPPAVERPAESSAVACEAFLDRLGGFAEFVIRFRQERQCKGISAAELRSLEGTSTGP